MFHSMPVRFDFQPWEHAVTTSSQKLLSLGFGYAISQTLKLVIELGIAGLLKDGPRTVEELARASGTDASALHRVLRLIAGEGVFEETEAGTFRQSELSDALRADFPDSPGNFIRMINSESYLSWAEAMHSVRTGKPAFEKVFGAPRFQWLAQHPEQAALFQRAMVAHGQGNEAAVAQAYDFSAQSRVVDVGGGHGRLLSAIIALNPHVQGVLLDLAAGIDAARSGLGGPMPGCELVTGDFFAALPTGGDVYIMKRVIHDWDDERAALILSNCRQAMAAGGKVVVAETILPEGNDRHPIKTLDAQMLVMTGGMERTRDHFEALFAQAGLRLTQVIPTTAEVSLIEGEVP
jgi:SAM-dependent methyltransferase